MLYLRKKKFALIDRANFPKNHDFRSERAVGAVLSVLLGKQIERTRVLDRTGDSAVQLGRDAGRSARKDLAAFGGKFRKDLRMLESHFFNWNVEATARHAAVRSTEVGHSLSGLWLH